MIDDSTPLMKQYLELKSKVPDALLFFRMGDFYELFGDDAVIAAGILEITLTSRDKNKANPVPMAGVPHHSVHGYIQKLLKYGKKIAIGEQMEDSEIAKGAGKIVRREIVRVLTPGVQFDAEGAEANYLATVCPVTKMGLWVIACLDASTGEVLLSGALDLGTIAQEIGRLPIRHFLCADSDLDMAALGLAENVLVENLPKNYLSLERAEDLLKRHYDVGNLEAFVADSAGVLATGTLVAYALRTQQQERLAHLRLPEALQKPTSMVLGPNTAQHLDLQELFGLINRTRSTPGARQLKRWMWAPLRNVQMISARQEAVQELAGLSSGGRERLSAELGKIYDLERICGRVNTNLANPRDTLALGRSLAGLGAFGAQLTGCKAGLLADLRDRVVRLSEALGPLAERIVTHQKEEAPFVSREGGIFNTGMSADLDRLIALTQDGQKWLVDLENREREKTGIPSLKVRYNRVFGYYIEITSAHLKNVPSHYQRKQTMVGAERFFTEELKKFEEEILTASVKQKSLEQELFAELIRNIQKLTSPIMEAAQVFGDLDALFSLSLLRQQAGWCLPQIDESLALEVVGGRHPMVDLSSRGRFVPNSVELSPMTRMTLLITGPNMGGKSTVMRQTALIVILGQMGAPVPAQGARWGVVDALYTRIGAQDAIARGQSTFMVEMSELAHILHGATERALIVLDEIGRGTSTYDGISVAWATLEWICKQVRARTLFATHYHELVRLEGTLPLLANAHMAVDGTKSASRSALRFLYELREGPTNESFGIHVAQLAGLPKPVIQRAWKILEELESSAGAEAGGAGGGGAQMSLFGAGVDAGVVPLGLRRSVDSRPGVSLVEAAPPEPDPVIQELVELDIEGMTPLQALNFVAKLKEDCARRDLESS